MASKKYDKWRAFMRRKARRPITFSVKRLERTCKRTGLSASEERPRNRAECIVRRGSPCPFVSCRYHLYLDVDESSGALKLNYPGLDVWELEETCALDVAEGEGETLDRIGGLLNMTRERVRQIEDEALLKMWRARRTLDGVRDL